MGQVEDRVDGASGTGLTYLNARYYDPATSRFISPDPLMDPGDPSTLDPYRYADNNPIVFTDATGLRSTCASSASDEAACMGSAANQGVDFQTGSTDVVHTRAPVTSGSTGGILSPSDVLAMLAGLDQLHSGGISSGPDADPGEVVVDWAAASGGGILSNYRGIASKLFRQGTSIGSWLMRQLRGKPWLRHTLRTSGRFGSNLALGALDGVFAVASAADNYFFRYDGVENQADCVQFTVERTLVTEGPGYAVGQLTDPWAVGVCGVSEGTLCAPAIVASAGIQTGVSEGLGLLYDWLNAGRVAAASGDESPRRRFMLSDFADWL